MRFWLTTVLALAAAAPATADSALPNIITSHDQERLQQYPSARDEALKQAREGAAQADIAELDMVLGKPHLSFADADSGEWQCRTIKVGGLLPLVIYDWFRCRVTDDGSGWKLEKLTGSQRTRGRFFTDGDDRLVYLGSYHVAGDTPPAYGAGRETDQVGYAYRTGESEWHIEFPLPVRESTLDILQFRRNPVPATGNGH